MANEWRARQRPSVDEVVRLLEEAVANVPRMIDRAVAEVLDRVPADRLRELASKSSRTRGMFDSHLADRGFRSISGR